MKAAETLLYLQKNGITVFTTKDYAKIIGKPIHYAQNFIDRIPGVKRAEKGVYYIPQANIYEIASNVVPFSYVSMLSALRFYDLTTQVPVVISVVSPKKHRTMRIEGYKIVFIRLNNGVIFGQVRRGNAFVAAPEKAILDSLYYNRYAYIDEALERGIREEQINVDKMVEYALMFKKKSLLNKLGFFLEEFAGVDKPDLLDKISKKPVHLISKAENYNKKWRVYYG